MSSRGVPEVLFKKVDEYVDSLAPQIQPRITTELETFQQKTIDSLEDKVVDAFRSLFDKDKKPSDSRSLDDNAPDAYGGQSLPFADEIAKLTRSFTKITDEAGDDLRDILTSLRDAVGEVMRRDLVAGAILLVAVRKVSFRLPLMLCRTISRTTAAKALEARVSNSTVF
ncbi:hypothetical protein SNK04_007812 [Fusarium graminearum]